MTTRNAADECILPTGPVVPCSLPGRLPRRRTQGVVDEGPLIPRGDAHPAPCARDLASLSPAPVYVRAHNLLTTGDGTAALKWGSTNAYIEVGGEATEGTLVQGSKIAVPESIESSDSQYDALQGLLAAWKTGHQDSPSQYAANGWDCMLILQQALEAGKVQPGDPQKTRDAIRDSLEANVKDLPGINAIYSFGPDSHGPSDIKGLAVLTVQNKKFSLLQSF